MTPRVLAIATPRHRGRAPVFHTLLSLALLTLLACQSDDDMGDRMGASVARQIERQNP